MRWFFFGSLLDPEVRTIVVGREPSESARRPGILHGYRRVRVADESYPALKPQPGGRVAGLVVDDLDEHESRRVCFFEGEEFIAWPRTIEQADGRHVEALVFLAGANLALIDSRWDFHAWRATCKARFLDMSREFMAGFEVADWHELDRQWRADQRLFEQDARQSL